MPPKGRPSSSHISRPSRPISRSSSSHSSSSISRSRSSSSHSSSSSRSHSSNSTFYGKQRLVITSSDNTTRRVTKDDEFWNPSSKNYDPDYQSNSYRPASETYGDYRECIKTDTYKCPYCDLEVQIRQDETTDLQCPQCAGNLKKMKNEENAVNENHYSYVYDDRPDVFGGIFTFIKIAAKIFACMIVISLVLVFAGFAFIGFNNINFGSPDKTTSYEDIYVNPLERTVSWSYEYDCYYDALTDCYFVYNEDLYPPIWQYWFESISSDFGDYGWMEYDFGEECWYIETGESQWEVLPSQYENDINLWHFAEE